MGAWSDGLVANSKRMAEYQARVAKHKQDFKTEFLTDSDISVSKLYLLCLRRILMNQKAVLESTSEKATAIHATKNIIKRLEKFLDNHKYLELSIEEINDGLYYRKYTDREFYLLLLRQIMRSNLAELEDVDLPADTSILLRMLEVSMLRNRGIS